MPDRILVVEDEPLVRDLIVLNLQHAGYEVAAVGTCEEGLRAVVNEPPALAIFDGSGQEFRAAIDFAIAASALSVTRAGAQAALPTREEVERFLKTKL